MGDFLQSWRRKAGIALLVMACAVMMVWARGLAAGDSIGFITDGGMYFVSATDHGLECRKSLDPPAIGSPRIWWHHVPVNSVPVGFLNVEDTVAEPALRTMSHWAIVLPMVILAAYLVLLTPRRSPECHFGPEKQVR